MDGSAESGLGRVALADTLQNPLDIAHSVGFSNERNRSQGFGVSKIGLPSRELHKTALEGIQRDIPLRLEQYRELMPFAANALWLDVLRNALVEPRRTPSCRELGDKRMRQFMLKNMGQFRRHRG